MNDVLHGEQRPTIDNAAMLWNVYNRTIESINACVDAGIDAPDELWQLAEYTVTQAIRVTKNIR